MNKPEIEIRSGTRDDWSFVFATWLRSYKYSSEFAKTVPEAIYYKAQHKIVDDILEGGAKLEIAAPVGDPSTILGYMVHAGPVLHFVYVKKSFRRMGIAGALIGTLGAGTTEFSHKSYDAEHLLKRLELKYNPYSAMMRP